KVAPRQPHQRHHAGQIRHGGHGRHNQENFRIHRAAATPAAAATTAATIVLHRPSTGPAATATKPPSAAASTAGRVRRLPASSPMNIPVSAKSRPRAAGSVTALPTTAPATVAANHAMYGIMLNPAKYEASPWPRSANTALLTPNASSVMKNDSAASTGRRTP